MAARRGPVLPRRLRLVARLTGLAAATVGTVKRTVGREQYFTDAALAQRCIDFTDELVGLDRFPVIVEPSAGTGAFYDLLPAGRRVGIDIEPTHDDVVEADFLSWDPPVDRPVLTIGNPPFGQRGSLAVAFVKAACDFSDVVAFILPRSFNKYTFQDRVPARFHLLGSFDCDDFHGPDGMPQPVKSVFQVWEKRDDLRPRTVLRATHPDFDMRHCHLSRASAEQLERLRTSYPFAVAQVGVNFAPRDSADVTRGSHWFIKPNAPRVREHFERLDFAFLDTMNTAHKSLSKRDIVAAYEAILERARGE
ncbi:MAG: hypothetical protein JWM93_119 [Frankiales bacterium]|nr:hypothetical protein [Frankiales bacterium]